MSESLGQSFIGSVLRTRTVQSVKRFQANIDTNKSAM